MIASKRLGRRAVEYSWLATCMLSALILCSPIGYSQADQKDDLFTKEQLAKNEAESKKAESKLWHETMEKFSLLGSLAITNVFSVLRWLFGRRLLANSRSTQGIWRCRQ